MNETRLSQRLQQVADYVPKDSILADIGSDHAYLPAWLILNQCITKAIAGEVVQGPYQSACQLVKNLHLENQITVRLASGLAAIESTDNISAITICGMGGKLITDILEQGYLASQLSGDERLILQPNIGEKLVRQWLQQHQYKIVAESILEEDQKIYEIIVAEKSVSPVTYSDVELEFGPFLLTEKSEVFQKKWKQELLHLERVLSQLKKAKTTNQKLEQELYMQTQQITEVVQ